MKIWNVKDKSYVSLVTLLCLLFSISISAQPAEPLQLKSGLWEGINSDSWDYNLLELDPDGKHRFFNLNIPSAFQKGRVWNFSDEQIICTNAECIINIDKKTRGSTRLIISPYIETSFKVLEINIDADGVPIFTRTYQLDQKKAPSTVRSFIDSHRNRLESLKEIQSDGIYGFWLGILWLNDKPELISLEVHPDKKSKLVRFINGQSYINESAFLPENVIVEQAVITIATEPGSFTSKLIINQLSDKQLNGYMYSTIRGKAVQTGNFSLSRMR